MMSFETYFVSLINGMWMTLVEVTNRPARPGTARHGMARLGRHGSARLFFLILKKNPIIAVMEPPTTIFIVFEMILAIYFCKFSPQRSIWPLGGGFLQFIFTKKKETFLSL